MSESYLESLSRKHRELEEEISEAMRHPSFDDLELVTLKRKKLAIKDEIEKVRSSARAGDTTSDALAVA